MPIPSSRISYFDAVTEVFRGCGQSRLVSFAISWSFFCRRVDPVRNQVEQNPGDFLWEDVNFSSNWIERSLYRNIEIPFLSPGAVIGEINAFLDERIDRHTSAFPRTFA